METIKNLLRNMAYPGRGIILGTSPDGRSLIAAYFIMGRSENSRNRIFEADNRAIRIKAYDESKLTDPSLVIYYPLRICGNKLIVTNGDQTDTIYSYIREGYGFETALHTRTFEPDSLSTPRISGLMDLADGSYRFNILKAEENECVRFFFEYPSIAGNAHFLSTYNGDNNTPLSFAGEPVSVQTEQDIDVFTSLIWDSLNEENKVSLFVRYIDLKTKEFVTRIVNKFGGEN